MINKNKGFTLMEVLIATAIVTTGIMAIMIPVQEAIRVVYGAQERHTAVFLTKEGMDIVRNIRDTNFLNYPADLWNKNIPAGNWEADYDDTFLDDDYDGDLLRIDGSGFYNYATGTPTIFRRKITITNLSADSLRVEVTVKWRYHTLTFEEKLYNWR